MHAYEKVENLVLIAKGTCHLYGFNEIDDDNIEKILIVKLKKQSWFGDFQIMLDLEMSFQLEAGEEDKKHNRMAGYIQVYNVSGDTLNELC